MVITHHGGQCFKVTFGDLTLVFDPSIAAKPVFKIAARRIKASAQSHAKSVVSIQRRSPHKNAPVLATKKTATARRGAR